MRSMTRRQHNVYSIGAHLEEVSKEKDELSSQVASLQAQVADLEGKLHSAGDTLESVRAFFEQKVHELETALAAGKMVPREKRSLPPERASINRKFEVGSLKMYVTVGFYNDGTPG